ncbi:toll/interleukin-1 receptor domain-containing protein [Lachnospiraceae bacterium 66-29]
MEDFSKKLFICFSAKDRYNIVQPIVYHLKNYGVNVWYDRYEMVMGDDRFKKNIEEGAGKCGYALIVLSPNTINSVCATEEINILKSRYYKKEIIVFPVLYELKPCDIPPKFGWISNLIFKEVNRTTGTLEICNHIACKITNDIIDNCRYKTIEEIVNSNLNLPKPIKSLLEKYTKIDNANLNSRVALLYATYIIIVESYNLAIAVLCEVPTKAFERLFTETLLNLTVDYRELWLLENSMCILIEYYFISCTESKM